MINDKCSGFALITVMFMLVTLITGIFLAAYPLVSSPRDDSRQILSDLKDRKVKQAMFGRLAYQKGGFFSGCEGVYSDSGISQGAVSGRYQMLPFTKLGWWEGGTGGTWSTMGFGYCSLDNVFPPPFSYDAERGFWAGYRGKCYCSRSPLYESPFVDGFGESLIIETHCNKSHGVRIYHWGGKWKGGGSTLVDGGTPGNNMNYIIREYNNIKIKDYTKTPGDKIYLDLISAMDGDVSPWNLDYIETVPHGDHNLHIFSKSWSTIGRNGKVSYRQGLIKAVIRINNVPVYTTSIVIPFECECHGDGSETTGKFIEEIEYRETP